MNRPTWAHWALALAVAFVFATPPAAASDFWAAAGAEPTKFDKLMSRGDRMIMNAVNNHGYQRKEWATKAVEAYEGAMRAAPTEGEAYYRAAEVLYAFFLYADGASINRSYGERAVKYWSEFERVSPRDPRTNNFLFRRSIVLTKLGGAANYELALDDYERELALLVSSFSNHAGTIATVLSNSAEILMTLGRLDEAITHYERSLEYNDRPLFGYGLAVALDRDGQETKAREVMGRYVRSDKLRALNDPGVFFIPQGDDEYYRALGSETLGQFEAAREHYRRYLRYNADSPYAGRARSHLERLDGKKDTRPTRPNSPWDFEG